MEEKVRIAYAEIFEILSYMEKAKVMKIPTEILQSFKENRKKGYISKIDKNDIYNKENITETTLNILAYLNLNYWVDENKRKELVSKYRINDYEKMLEAKQYYSNEIEFKNKEKKDIKNEKTDLITEKAENIFMRILKKLYRFFINKRKTT